MEMPIEQTKGSSIEGRWVAMRQYIVYFLVKAAHDTETDDVGPPGQGDTRAYTRFRSRTTKAR